MIDYGTDDVVVVVVVLPCSVHWVSVKSQVLMTAPQFSFFLEGT